MVKLSQDKKIQSLFDIEKIKLQILDFLYRFLKCKEPEFLVEINDFVISFQLPFKVQGLTEHEHSPSLLLCFVCLTQIQKHNKYVG